MELVKQRVIELRHQKQILRQELADWRTRTQKGEKLEKHFTQVLAISAQLDGFLDKMGEPDETSAEPFKSCDKINRLLIGAHRVWAYFRSKLALREVDWLADDLKCADELAWECYRPAREKAAAVGSIPKDGLKEPPLVFFSNDASPFAQARHSVFEPELINEQGDVKRLGEALLLLPIAVIGVPWFQVDHLPMAVVVAHEVGHAVEHDFKLEKPLADAFAALNVPGDRKPAWSSWRDELFADAYGVLCTGPAYVQALMDFVAADPTLVQQERLEDPKWGRYPNRFLRMLVNFRLLAQIGIANPTLEKVWQDTYQFHLMQPFEADLPAVVSALLDTPLPMFGSASIREVVSFSNQDVGRVNELAQFVNGGIALPAGEPFRRLYPATTVAYYADQESYVRRNAHKAIVQRMLASIPPGVRSSDKVLQPSRITEIETIYRQAGGELMAVLSD